MMRATRFALGWKQRILAALVLLNVLCGISLWAGGPRIYSGMPLVVLRLDTQRSLSATVQLIHTGDPFGSIPASWASWPPNALRLHARVRAGPLQPLVYAFSYILPMRLLAVLPVGASLALVALMLGFRRISGAEDRSRDAYRDKPTDSWLPFLRNRFVVRPHLRWTGAMKGGENRNALRVAPERNQSMRETTNQPENGERPR